MIQFFGSLLKSHMHNNGSSLLAGTDRSWAIEDKTRAAAGEAERAAALKAEQKAERDARYAARKAAKKVRRRGY